MVMNPRAARRRDAVVSSVVQIEAWSIGHFHDLDGVRARPFEQVRPVAANPIGGSVRAVVVHDHDFEVAMV
jgi:hypothetical protein